MTEPPPCLAHSGGPAPVHPAQIPPAAARLGSGVGLGALKVDNATFDTVPGKVQVSQPPSRSTLPQPSSRPARLVPPWTPEGPALISPTQYPVTANPGKYGSGPGCNRWSPRIRKDAPLVAYAPPPPWRLCPDACPSRPARPAPRWCSTPGPPPGPTPRWGAGRGRSRLRRRPSCSWTWTGARWGKAACVS